MAGIGHWDVHRHRDWDVDGPGAGWGRPVTDGVDWVGPGSNLEVLEELAPLVHSACMYNKDINRFIDRFIPRYLNA